MSTTAMNSQFDSDGCQQARFHEAGHAVAAIRLNVGLAPIAIEIMPNCDAATNVLELPLNEQTAEWCLRRAAVKLSGGAAEIRLRNQVFHPDTFESDFHYFGDYNEARHLLWRREAHGGESQPLRVDEQLVEALVKAHDVIQDNWSDVEKVAHALSSKPSLSAEEIVAILAK